MFKDDVGKLKGTRREGVVEGEGRKVDPVPKTTWNGISYEGRY